MERCLQTTACWTDYPRQASAQDGEPTRRVWLSSQQPSQRLRSSVPELGPKLLPMIEPLRLLRRLALTLNGRPFEPSKLNVGFVPQAYLLFKELTVRENLLYAAALRLDRRVGAARRAQIVDAALELLADPDLAASPGIDRQ